MGSTRLRITFISLSGLLRLERLVPFLPSSLFIFYSLLFFVAPMTAYDDLMPDSWVPQTLCTTFSAVDILLCAISCNKQALEHIDDYDVEVGGQSENKRFRLPLAATSFYRTTEHQPLPYLARLFWLYTLYHKRPGYAFCSTYRPSCTILFYFLSVSQGARTTETLIRYYDDRTVTANQILKFCFIACI
jgi:hypothetical protein